MKTLRVIGLLCVGLMLTGVGRWPLLSGPRYPYNDRTNFNWRWDTGIDYFATALLTGNLTECTGAALAFSDGTTISTTRSTTAYCTKTDGTLVSTATNTARVNGTGLLTEIAASNFLKSSEAFNSVDWTCVGSAGAPVITANATAAPNGATTAELFVSPSVAVGGYSNCYQGLNSLTPLPWTYTVYLKGNSTSGTFPIGSSNFATGSSTFCAYNASTWVRCRHTVPLIGVNTAFNVGIDCFGQGCSGGAYSIYIWGAQTENTNYFTSYIPTTSSFATRNADVVSFTPPVAMSSVGCVSATVTNNAVFPSAMTIRVISQGASVYPLGINTATQLRMQDSTNTVNSTVASVAGRTMRLIAGWGGSTMSLSEQGVAAGSGSFDGSMLAAATTYIGSQNGTQAVQGFIKEIKLGIAASGCTR